MAVDRIAQHVCVNDSSYPVQVVPGFSAAGRANFEARLSQASGPITGITCQARRTLRALVQPEAASCEDAASRATFRAYLLRGIGRCVPVGPWKEVCSWVMGRGEVTGEVATLSTCNHDASCKANKLKFLLLVLERPLLTEVSEVDGEKAAPPARQPHAEPAVFRRKWEFAQNGVCARQPLSAEWGSRFRDHLQFFLRAINSTVKATSLLQRLQPVPSPT